MRQFIWVVYVFISWPFELLWEQVIRPLREGPPELTFELMKLVEQDPGLLKMLWGLEPKLKGGGR